MPIRLPITFDIPSQRYRTTVSGVEYFVRLVYRDRTESWYMDLYDAAGDPIVFGRRLAPGWAPMMRSGVGAGRTPPGAFVVEAGPDGPVLLYFDPSEFPAKPVSPFNVVLL